MANALVKVVFASVFAICLMGPASKAADPAAIVGALRISGIVTGGMLPTNSPEFSAMVSSVTNGDYYGAALTAIQSQYGTRYLLRRLAFQMQTPDLQASVVIDNDATAFLIAHFAGAGGIPASISKIWSNNMTCLVTVTRSGVATPVHASDLTATELNTIDWRSALVCSPGQMAIDAVAATDPPTKIMIPAKHVGGYVTLSDRSNDRSFAENGAAGGTNLRYIANLWMIATGLDLLAFASPEGRPQNVPRFVPENDPHFVNGNGQTACIACHAGGLVALNHGYSTLADLFDYSGNGLSYIKTPTTGSMKSLGSNARNRQKTLTCNLAQFDVCNSDSLGADVNQSWDLAPTWGARGFLNTLGWGNAPTAGQGLNTLGAAIGKAGIVYSNLVKRVMKEICPLGAVSASDVASIAAVGQASDDIKVMIAQIASNPACR